MILGSSSGFGEANCRRLAKSGYNIVGVHFDRKAAMPRIEQLVADLKATGREVHFFNVNAGDKEKRTGVIEELVKCSSGGPKPPVRVLLHSIAFGTLRPFVGDNAMDQKAMNMTLDVMAHSLVYWVKDLLAADLFGRGSRIFAMTSGGSERIWVDYGAVSAAKCALESHIRQLAVELAPLGITANAIRAGVTDTAALRKIPGAKDMVELALRLNPHNRLTTPEDVANAICELSHPDTKWITGNVINVDGGEQVAG